MRHLLGSRRSAGPGSSSNRTLCSASTPLNPATGRSPASQGSTARPCSSPKTSGERRKGSTSLSSSMDMFWVLVPNPGKLPALKLAPTDPAVDDTVFVCTYTDPKKPAFQVTPAKVTDHLPSPGTM